jgi:hypothetical protein
MKTKTNTPSYKIKQFKDYLESRRQYHFDQHQEIPYSLNGYIHWILAKEYAMMIDDLKETFTFTENRSKQKKK